MIGRTDEMVDTAELAHRYSLGAIYQMDPRDMALDVTRLCRALDSERRASEGYWDELQSEREARRQEDEAGTPVSLLGFRQDLIDQAHRDSVELILEVIGAQRGLDEDLWTLTTAQADRLIEAIRAEDDA